MPFLPQNTVLTVANFSDRRDNCTVVPGYETRTINGLRWHSYLNSTPPFDDVICLRINVYNRKYVVINLKFNVIYMCTPCRWPPFQGG